MTGQNNTTVTLSAPGIGFAGLLTVAFIVLKLTGYITWSWFWVLAPLWISIAFSLLILLVVGLVAFALLLWQDRQRVKQRNARRARLADKRWV